MLSIEEMQSCVRRDVKDVWNKWKCGVAEMASSHFLLREVCPISGPPDIAAHFWVHHSHSLSHQLYDSDSPCLIPIYLFLS